MMTSMGLRRHQIIARLQRELVGVDSVRVINEAHRWLPDGVQTAHAHEAAGLVLVAPDVLSEDGSVTLPFVPTKSTRVIAVLLLLGDTETPFLAAAPEPRQRVHRIITELAVLDVNREGLTIVELAPGVSARDVQSHVAPTLLISPEVRTMDVSS